MRITHENIRLRDPAYLARFEKSFFDEKLPRKKSWILKGHATSIQLPNRCLLELRGAITNDNLADKIAEYQPSILISNSFDISTHKGSYSARATNLIQQCQQSKVACAVSLICSKNDTLRTLLKAESSNKNDVLQQIKRDFIDYALQAEQLGADAIELNLADGGLLSNLMSSIANRGTGYMSGDLAKRCEYAKDIFLSIKELIRLPILVRICACDYHIAGNQIQDGIAIARLFSQLGAAAICVSSGGILTDSHIHKGRIYNGLFADEIRNTPLMREYMGTAIICTGSINKLDQVDMMVASGRSDLVAVDGLSLTLNHP